MPNATEDASVQHLVLHFTDLHLGGAVPWNLPNWERCLGVIAGLSPDLVVLGGDIMLDDVDDAADRVFARAQVGRIAAPWRAVPGNHDIGDDGPAPYRGQAITPQRRARYCDAFGPDWWAQMLGRWQMIGLNSLLFASDLPAEREQWCWLRDRLSGCRGHPVALFFHKPLCLDSLDEAVTTQATVTQEGRRRLLDAVAGSDVRLIVTGHTHRHRALLCGGMAMVWTPSIGQVNHRFEMPRGGRQRAGFMAFRFAADAVEWELLPRGGLPEIDITDLSARHGGLRDVPAEAARAWLESQPSPRECGEKVPRRGG